MVSMAYCEKCGMQMDSTANFCPNCGNPVKGYSGGAQTANNSDTARTVATIAGTAVGVSLLNRLFRHRHCGRPMPPPPPRGMGCGPFRRPPMGGFGGRRRGF